jgi:GAF domain-containing protein
MHRPDLSQTSNLSTRALQFLLDLPDLDAPPEELIGTLCVLAGETQPGAIVGGTIIDGASATFDKVIFPCLPGSVASRLRRSPVGPPYIGACAQAVCERKPVTCPNISTETRFDAGWRRLFLGQGIQSVQSAPVFSFNGKALGTFVVAFNEPKAAASFDMEMMVFGVHAMRTILQDRDPIIPARRVPA